MSDLERTVRFKRDPLKGCKKTSGMIVSGEGSKGAGTAGGGRAAFCRLIYERLPKAAWQKAHSKERIYHFQVSRANLGVLTMLEQSLVIGVTK